MSGRLLGPSMVVSRRPLMISNLLDYEMGTDLDRPCLPRRHAALWYVKIASAEGYFEVTHTQL